MKPQKSPFLAFLLLAPTLAMAAPEPLTWQNYEAVKSHVSPKKEDFGFKQVDWNMDLPDAITEASKADKPLLLWLYFGNPLGHC